ncbi:MAG: chemotaxis protein CheA [Deltaproteobacteria bacterium]|jgi:two-component system chemotaxis sensor kinase CheA|nr:chemotaxis protein CheA [Deltaproteobacteria bacterium]
MSEMELDAGLLQDFITESKELMDEYTSSLSAFESDPTDLDTINPVFRAAHTLKGSSAFFGLNHIKDFAHKLENLLDEIRHATRPANPKAIEYLYLAGNHLKAMFDRLSEGDTSVNMTQEESAFLSELVNWMESTGSTSAGSSGASNGQGGNYQEACIKIKSLLAQALDLGTDPDQLIQDITNLINSLPITTEEKAKGKAAFIRPQAVHYKGVELTEPILAAIDNICASSFDPKGFDSSLKEIGNLVKNNSWTELEAKYQVAMEDFTAVYESGLDFDPILVDLVKNKFLDFVSSLDITNPEAEPEQSPTSSQAAKGGNGAAPVDEAKNDEPRKEKDAKQEHKTMRISEEKVDGFMSYVGELIVTAETFNYLQKTIEQEKVNPNTIRAFKNANQAFRELSDELQESLMEIRRVPIKGILQKVNMMARELSHQLGKQVKVVLEGQDVQLDKSIAESLEAPLVHVVRNSMDHGFELPDIRQQNGKPLEGLLKVTAAADKEFFYMTVEDDGKGIDPEVMRTVAVAKGMMNETQAAALTDKEAIGLIFGAGFSTAKEITDVSGRGVGMDVVRTNISALNGSINVDSKVGHGTTITLKIPLSVTLQVIKALHVRVGQANFIISLDEILESLRPAPDELSTVEGRGLILNRRGQITPLIKLYELFDLEPEHPDPSDGLLVMVETLAGRYALLVDEVMGQQQVVVKELGEQFKRLNFLAGSALLGDGGLGLVLAADGIVRLAFGLDG